MECAAASTGHGDVVGRKCRGEINEDLKTLRITGLLVMKRAGSCGF